MQEIKKPVRLKPECISCLLKSRLDFAPEGISVEKKLDYMQSVLRAISELEYHESAPVVVRTINMIQKEMFGVSEDFTDVKVYFNDLMMSKVPELQKNLDESEDSLKLGIQYAITGNYIDFGAMNHVDETILQKYMDDAKSIELNESEYASLQKDIADAKSIVYLTDNCGEVVLDKLLMAEIGKRNPNAKITAVVRGADVLNDATVVDAAQVKLEEVAEVMGNGSDIAGTFIDEISDEARELLETADVILAKGQANFETMQECGLNVYYIFMCKCEMFARRFGVPRFTGMLINDRRM